MAHRYLASWCTLRRQTAGSVTASATTGRWHDRARHRRTAGAVPCGASVPPRCAAPAAGSGQNRLPGSLRAHWPARRGRARWPSPRSAPPRCWTAGRTMTARSACWPSAAETIGGPGADVAWPWPAPRLSYANARSPRRSSWQARRLVMTNCCAAGCGLLEWLLAGETCDGHLSWSRPAAGARASRGPASTSSRSRRPRSPTPAPGRRASPATRAGWRGGHGVAWFLGDNDAGVPLLDPETGGGCDGLTATGRTATRAPSRRSR